MRHLLFLNVSQSQSWEDNVALYLYHSSIAFPGNLFLKGR